MDTLLRHDIEILRVQCPFFLRRPGNGDQRNGGRRHLAAADAW